MAKRVGSTYRAGRSPDWQKLKCTASQELVIGGWTEPQGSRVGFGALLVGYYDEAGALRYAGKVGTGFSDKLLRDLHWRLVGLEVAESPFAEVVREPRVHWARPELVAAVSFTEWTSDGRLRHPSFQGLRPDKVAGEVRREAPPEQVDLIEEDGWSLILMGHSSNGPPRGIRCKTDGAVGAGE